MFIINEDGIIRHISINDFPVGRELDEVLRLVDAFQYTDKHGEVCPAGWRPGQPTMVYTYCYGDNAELMINRLEHQPIPKHISKQ